MSGETNADVYASFGVRDGVTAGTEDHAQAMLELDVAVRDGDDAILIKEEEETQGNDIQDKEAPQEEEGDNEEQEAQEEAPEEEEQGSIDLEPVEGVDIEAVKTDILDAVKLLDSHEQAFQDMVNQAVENGVTEDDIYKMEQEYKENQELSSKSYEVLQKAGYSKAMVDAFIQGQASIVNQYTNAITGLAGGAEQFGKLYDFLEATEPDLAESLIKAMESKDVKLIQSMIRLAQDAKVKKYGKPAKRTLTQRAIPAAPVSVKPKGFASQEEIVKAMSDPRYSRDAKYRAEVETKMAYTTIF